MTFQTQLTFFITNIRQVFFISVQLATHTIVKSLPVLLLVDKGRQRGYNNKLQEVIQRKTS